MCLTYVPLNHPESEMEVSRSLTCLQHFQKVLYIPEGVILAVQWGQLAFKSMVVAVDGVYWFPFRSPTQHLHGNLNVA